MTTSSLALLSYGAYVPHHRVDRTAIAAAIGAPAGRGTRAVASHDEDTTSMAVEAGRLALAEVTADIDGVTFVTTAPAYLDKTNATAIHAALRLPVNAWAQDAIGSVRNAATALRASAGASSPRLLLAADVRVGRPASIDEREGGDGAAALLVGPDGDGAIARFRGFGSATDEFLDRWRNPSQPTSSVWEERFGEHAYAPLVEQAVVDAIKQAGVAADAVDAWVVAGTHRRAAGQAAKALAAHGGEIVGDHTGEIGNTGAAHLGISLASVLDSAAPGQLIGVVSVVDGVDVALLETTDQLVAFREGRTRTVADQISAGRVGLPYTTWLTWRGLLDREPPRRPDPKRPAAPPALRSVRWKFGLVGARCTQCGTVNLPPQRVCVECRSVDQMQEVPMSGVEATVATFTIDRLTYSMSPPVVAAVLDFDGSGRLPTELTDVDPSEVAIGTRVEMTFRRMYTSDGVHNYFWKARPVRRAATTEEA